MYSKWENIDNLINNYQTLDEINESGIPIFKKDKLYYNTNISNTLVIGNRESNKENNFLIPTIDTIIKNNESLLIYDSNCLYEKTINKFKQSNYNVIRLDLDNLDESNKWNPLLLPFNIYKSDKDKCYDLLDEIGYYLFYEKSQDPYWVNSAISYFKGLVLYTFNYEKEISFKKIIELSDILKNNSTEITNKIDKNSDIYNNLISIIDAPLDTKMSIISVFTQKLKAITSRERLCNQLSDNDIDLNNLNKTVIYLKPRNNNLLNNILSMFISQLAFALNIKFNFILNNFNELYAINNFGNTLNQSLNKNIKFILTISSFNELKINYGKELSEIIKYNCSNIVYLLSNDYDTLKEICNLCGKKDENNCLITIEELKTMKLDEAIILIPRLYPIKTNLKEN